MIRNFTESYTLASDEPEPELGPETGPDAIISSSEGKGENIGPQRKQPGDNYCVSCSALLPPLSLFLCESHFQYCLQISRERECVVPAPPVSNVGSNSQDDEVILLHRGPACPSTDQ